MATHRHWLHQNYCKHSRFAPALHLPLFVGQTVLYALQLCWLLLGVLKVTHQVCTAAPHIALDTPSVGVLDSINFAMCSDRPDTRAFHQAVCSPRELQVSLTFII